jgi:hypothetical protein
VEEEADRILLCKAELKQSISWWKIEEEEGKR